MKKISIIFFALVLTVSAFAQVDTSFKLIAGIKGEVVDFSVDNFDNVYILSSTDQLKKYNSRGDSIAVFNNVRKFGKVGMVDVSNPLMILLYYRDFSTIVALDRVLSVKNTIDLKKLGLSQINAIGQSYDNNIWIYDEVNSKLKKIDEQGRVLMETSDFRLMFGEAPHITRIFDQDGFVYLYDPEKFVYVFDYYGAFRNKILITGWTNFKVAGKYIFGTAGDTLYRYSINTYRLDENPLPVFLRHVSRLNFTNARLYALKKDELLIYSF